ncbi:DUF6233 domain-containing protein [Streptomyces sp. NPDC057582]|uniref:DUF6233 domain-containing protein n=1 Tax=Streptomyces sp. NPDC057582 TaxID=3346174 RepID=UPI0036A75D37
MRRGRHHRTGSPRKNGRVRSGGRRSGSAAGSRGSRRSRNGRARNGARVPSRTGASPTGVGTSPSEVHRGACFAAGKQLRAISREQALAALGDAQRQQGVQPVVTPPRTARVRQTVQDLGQRDQVLGVVGQITRHVALVASDGGDQGGWHAGAASVVIKGFRHLDHPEPRPVSPNS